MATLSTVVSLAGEIAAPSRRVDMIKKSGMQALWVAHRRELIFQARDHLEAAGARTGIIMGTEPTDPGAPIQVGSVQTLAHRGVPDDVSLIVIDECHHATADSYAQLFESGAGIIGATATPFRMGGHGLGDMFGHLCVAATTHELVDQGYLVAPRIFSHARPKLDNVAITMGDYKQGDINDIMTEGKLVANVVETWMEHAQGLKTVLFATSVAHSKLLRDEFMNHSVGVRHIDAKTPKDEREWILKTLADGQTEIVCNVGIISEGWDLPDLECIIVARPTASLCLWLQMLGRVMRPKGRASIVLDHAGNAIRLGGPLQEIKYTLTPGEKVSPRSELRMCPECFLLVPRFDKTCNDCGYTFANVPAADVPEHERGTLMELDDEFMEQKMYWEMVEEDRNHLGNAPGWSKYRFKERFGDWPTLVDNELVNTKNATMQQKQAVYSELLVLAREKKFKDGWASYRYKGIFDVWPTGFVKDTKSAADRLGGGSKANWWEQKKPDSKTT